LGTQVGGTTVLTQWRSPLNSLCAFFVHWTKQLAKQFSFPSASFHAAPRLHVLFFSFVFLRLPLIFFSTVRMVDKSGGAKSGSPRPRWPSPSNLVPPPVFLPPPVAACGPRPRRVGLFVVMGHPPPQTHQRKLRTSRLEFLSPAPRTLCFHGNWGCLRSLSLLSDSGSELVHFRRCVI